jgi:hypothetical protein
VSAWARAVRGLSFGAMTKEEGVLGTAATWVALTGNRACLELGLWEKQPEEPMQGLRRGLLRAQPPEGPVQGLRYGPLRAWAPGWAVQGLPLTGFADFESSSSSGGEGSSHMRHTGPNMVLRAPSATTGARRADARTAPRATASTTAGRAGARTAVRATALMGARMGGAGTAIDWVRRFREQQQQWWRGGAAAAVVAGGGSSSSGGGGGAAFAQPLAA